MERFAAMGILADRHRDRDLHIRSQRLFDETVRAELASLVLRAVQTPREGG